MRYQFGQFSLDAGPRTLSKDGQPIPLSPKAFDVLQLLLQQRPNVVSKRTILDAVWEGIHVGESSLTMVVSELRRALGDDAHAPTFLKTYHRKGYSFCGAAVGRARPVSPHFWITHAGARYALDGAEAVVGRSNSANIWIDHGSISRLHARFVIEGDTVSLEDLGSTNGTFVSSKEVKERVVVNPGDTIRFGEVTVSFGSANVSHNTPTDRVKKN